MSPRIDAECRARTAARHARAARRDRDERPGPTISPISSISRRSLISLAIAGIALAGCTRVSDVERFPVVSDRLTIARTVPEPGALTALDAQIDFCFSGHVDPRALDDFDASLSSGLVVFDTQLELQLFAWRPPGTARGATSEAWCPGSVLSLTPTVPLRPGALHRVRLQPSAVGWGGEQLDITTPGWVDGEDGPAYLLEFTVDPEAAPDEGDSEGEPPAPAPTLRDLFAPGEVFAPDNPACSCHREGDELARERLDLRDPDAAFADLVLPTRLMATGFPMVAPRRPSESYLIQTLLRDPDGSALYGVLGEPMPPDEPLAHADMVALVRWIEGGALP